MRPRTRLHVVLAAGALLVGCTAGDTESDDTAPAENTAASAVSTSSPASDSTSPTAEDTTADSTSPESESTAAESTAPDETVPAGPAPGVTDDTIKVGVTYVDLASLEIASLNHGDYALAYQSLFDDINANGGIHGRMIEAVIAPVNPSGTEAAEAACLQLTQDEQVFAIMGFFQGDSVLCPLEAHQTMVIGGSMSPERLARAQAPWYTYESGTDLQSEVIRAFAEAGEFDGTLGVYGGPAEEAQINEIILPLLDELGVEVAETAVVDLGADVDVTASNAATAVVAERFRAVGVDQVLAVGSSGLGWASGVETTDYRPQLLLTDPGSIQAYVQDEAGRDLTVLDGAIAGNLYGPAQNIWEVPQMQECIQIVEAGGVPVPAPETIEAGSASVYVAGTTSCIAVALFRALVEAAGPNLGYESLAAAADGLEVQLPSQPEPVTYGPPPSADGDLPGYVYDWDPGTKLFVIREG